MASTIITKNSSTASAVPVVGDLTKGELAVNVTDKKIYTKDNSAAVVKLVGSLGNQEANAVAITGGSIAGITDLAVADGGTGASTASDARTNLGLGTIATQAASSVTITGGSVTGITDITVADGGTGASTAANARSNLGAAASGANSDITSLSGLTTALSVAQGGTGITSFGSGVATFLGTPSSANLLAAVTDETGTGSLVFANTPTLVAPILGTPTSGNFSTGTFTWPTFNQNTTGTAAGLSATLAIASGGTGATTAGGALTSLGAYAASNPSGYTSNTGTVTSVGGTGTVNGLTLTGTVTTSGNLTLGGTLSGVSLTSQVSGTLPTANGGTNLTSFTSGGVVYASSTSALATGSALTFDGTSLDLGTVGAKVNFATTGSATRNYIGLSADGYSLEMVTQRGAIQPLSYKQDFGAGHIWSITGSEVFRATSTSLYTASGINVGIGTSSPLTPLHAVGAIQSQRTGGVAQYARMVNSGGTATFISDNQASGTYTGFDFQGLSTASGTPVTYATITGAGNVGIGTSSPSSKLDVVRSATTTTAFDESVIRAINTGAATLNQRVDIALRFQDGTYNGIGGISMLRESATARSGSLSLSSIDSSGNPTNGIRLNSTGAVALLGASTTANGVGITFPATQSASSNANTLDDYEEGTWTPTLSFGGASVGITYGVNQGTYTKIGNLVTGRFVMGLTSKGSSTGDAQILGLPFVLGSSLGVAVTELAFTFTLSPPTNGWPQDGQTNINLWAMGATGITNTTDTSFSNTSRLDMWFQYFIV